MLKNPRESSDYRLSRWETGILIVESDETHRVDTAESAMYRTESVLHTADSAVDKSETAVHSTESETYIAASAVDSTEFELHTESAVDRAEVHTTEFRTGIDEF
ncbi:hypothetical protein AVEN_24350-1 [Araneus ventricosus]|uniref:Uncharacterized protein n=1 Tax=Araneus ventricosus TaxID=182803 RepID=A0A4Y2DI61_ARAVE|nr:hypothetical protein AVEN_24350-1 [Araneus ventricosus]